jgi:hypothetical protein
MAPDGSGNIRVFVRWHDQNVFAGEDVKCSITFRNVARPPGSAHGGNNANHGGQGPKSLSNSERPRQLSSLQQVQAQGQARNKAGGTLAPPTAPAGRGHRASLSLSVPSSSPRLRSGSINWSSTSSPSDVTTSRNGHTHRRSISIVSLGSASTADEPTQLLSNTSQAKAQRPGRGHSRAASLQIVSRLPAVNGPGPGPGPRSGEWAYPIRIKRKLKGQHSNRESSIPPL